MPERFFTVMYEDLVKNTVYVMQKICNFLNVTYSDTMTENVAPEWLIKVWSEQKKLTTEDAVLKGLLQPVNTSNIGKWKTALNEFDKAVIYMVTGEYARKKLWIFY